MDTLVFDIETKNFFTDPGVGWNNFDALEISMVCVYSYSKNKYFSFNENQLAEAAALFDSGSLLVGFSSNRYDIPVLEAHFGRLPGVSVNLWSKERFDLLEEIEMALGQRISLDKLSRANLGVGKERKGHEAITLYKNGEMEELEKYCLQDVRLTKDLYDLYRNKAELLVPDARTGETVKVNFDNAKTTALF
ncbi:MAG: ribonuclease H-like domain-containing protein [bacterium]|nr:ribonuclease H-like domain-containing protein [bacterium]